MAASWHLAPSLAQLRREINARWPNRDKSTDGTIGDAAHSSRASDHNPNSRGSVNAIDVDKDGIDAVGLVGLAIKDPRVNYVIYNRRIWQRKYGFKPRPYSGLNAHKEHVHVSILQSIAAEQNAAPWGVAKIGASPVKPSTGGAPAPKPRPSRADIVRMAQQVIAGKHGNGHENRRRSLGVDAATYAQVRAEVNRRV